MKKIGLAFESIFYYLFLVAFIIGINYISFKHYKRWNFSSSNRFTLSPQTKDILKKLDKDITVYVCFSPGLITYDWVKLLLEQYTNCSSHLHVKYINVVRDVDKAKLIFERYKIRPQNVVIFTLGNKHKIVYERDLVDMDYSPVMRGGVPVPSAFNGEMLFTSAIAELSSGIKPTVIFLTGHGERSIDDMQAGIGIKQVAQILEKQGYVVKKAIGLNWKPEKHSVLVICRPKTDFLPQEMKKIDEFLHEGGRLLFLADPDLPASLRQWFKESYSVLIGDNVVVDPLLNVLSPVNLLVNYYGLHPITKPFIGTALLLTMACSVDPIENDIGNSKQETDQKNNQKNAKTSFFKFSKLLFSSAKSWAESDWREGKYSYDKGKDLEGPVCLAVAGENNSAGSRIVVIGDSDFVTNVAVDNLNNRDFFLATINWLLELNNRINIGPKPIKTIKLNIAYARLRMLFLFTVVFLPLGIMILGLIVVILRRRQR